MGLKKGGNSLIYNLKIHNQTQPIFEFMEKIDKEWRVADTSNAYEGYLQGMDISHYEYKGDKNYNLNMYFKDEEGVAEKVSVNFNSLCLNILNTFSNEDTLVGRLFTITVYEKNEMPKIYIEIDGNETSWKFDGAQVKALHKAGHEKWIELFNTYIKPKLAIAAQKVSPPRADKLSGNSAGEEFAEALEDSDDLFSDVGDMDDLPF